MYTFVKRWTLSRADAIMWDQQGAGTCNQIVRRSAKAVVYNLPLHRWELVHHIHHAVSVTLHRRSLDSFISYHFFGPIPVTPSFWPLLIFNTLWLDCIFTIINILRLEWNGWHFADDIFECIFLNENWRILITISLKYVSKGPASIKQSLV